MLFVTSVRYLFTRVPLYRRDRTSEAGSLPDFERDLPGGPSTVQRVADGTGALYHRHFWIDFTDAELGPEELISTLADDLNSAAPDEMSTFERDDDERSRSLQVGAELVVRLPGPWDGPVRVIDRTPTSFRFATLAGHMEAGEIEFRCGPSPSGRQRFEIETWARSGDPRFRVLYDTLPLAREAQAYMWSHFCTRAPKLAGGIVMSNVAVNTERYDIGPWLGVAADRRPAVTAPVSGRATRALLELPGRPYNFDPDDVGTHACEDGWHSDDYRVTLPREAPGPPVDGGSWTVARELCEAYAFADRGLVRAVYFADVPLDEREMLLEGRFLFLRFPLGVRVGEVVDRSDVVDGRPLRCWGWNYRTLAGHLERGQMDFEVRKWIDTGDVEFRIHACSSPAHIPNPVHRFGFWIFGRTLQVRFARRSVARMRRLVERRVPQHQDAA